jgi:hypothetical protein
VIKKFKAIVEKQSDWQYGGEIKVTDCCCCCIKVLRTMVVVSTPQMNLTNSVKMKEYYMK